MTKQDESGNYLRPAPFIVKSAQPAIYGFGDSEVVVRFVVSEMCEVFRDSRDAGSGPWP